VPAVVAGGKLEGNTRTLKSLYMLLFVPDLQLCVRIDEETWSGQAVMCCQLTAVAVGHRPNH